MAVIYLVPQLDMADPLPIPMERQGESITDTMKSSFNSISMMSIRINDKDALKWWETLTRRPRQRQRG